MIEAVAVEVLLDDEAHLDDLRAAVRVEVDGAGARLDRFLGERLGVSARELARLAAAGRVRLDGRAVLVGAPRLEVGQVVVVLAEHARPALLPEDLPVTVLAEDDGLLLVDKPAGIAVHPGDGWPAGTLVNALRGRGVALSQVEGPLRAGLVHRLDWGTSGVLAVAKRDDVHRQAIRAFLAHAVARRYVALVHGQPAWDEHTLAAPLARARAGRKAQAVRDDGRPARTAFTVRARLGPCALVEARPETGRTHQIRVHLRHLGHPLVGDTLYGGGDGARRRLWGRLGVRRPLLHAEHLALLGRAADAPWPADLQRAVELLSPP
jgi:23S rRNA pseudouridine1911/1915/1917 synthase